MGQLSMHVGGDGPGEIVQIGGQLPVGYIRMTGNGIDVDTVTLTRTEDGVTITRIYELDTAAVATITAGRVRVDISAAATAAATVTALVAAINGDASRVCEALDVGGDVVALVFLPSGATGGTAMGRGEGSLVITATLAETLTNGIVSAAAATGGEARVNADLYRGTYTVTAADVTSLASAVGTEIVIGAMNTTAAPLLYSFIVLRGANGAIVSPNTIEPRIAQINTNRYALMIQDDSVVLQNADIIRWIALAAVEA